MKRTLVISVVILVLALPGTSRGVADAPSRPNIVLILTDDQRWDQIGPDWMPTVESLLADKGVTFTNGFVSNPLCCPSRATILTGETSGHNGVWTNEGKGVGGFHAFHDSSTIATWLHADGYRTGLVGKYLNGYMSKDIAYVPPGWDEWDALALGGSPACTRGGYYNYCLSHNGLEEDHGRAEADYSTDVLGADATSFIASTPADQPLFLYYAPRAPHAPTTPPSRYQEACPSVSLPMPASYNEVDVSDKPAYIQNIHLRSPKWVSVQQRFWTKACQTLHAVDDTVGDVLNELHRTGRLSNTLVLFASDNGLLYGEHRWLGKIVPYEESIRVPTVARYDPVTAGVASTSSALVVNLDFASTFAAAAGVVPGLPQDGESFFPLLSDPGARWRSRFLLEHFGGPQAPAYCGVRTRSDFVYVRYATGEEELYDLTNDPYQLQNSAGKAGSAKRLQNLRGDTARLCDPPPPGWISPIGGPG
jgi:N-acetylglucosamine-6-sulfatase